MLCIGYSYYVLFALYIECHSSICQQKHVNGRLVKLVNLGANITQRVAPSFNSPYSFTEITRVLCFAVILAASRPQSLPFRAAPGDEVINTRARTLSAVHTPNFSGEQDLCVCRESATATVTRQNKHHGERGSRVTRVPSLMET